MWSPFEERHAHKSQCGLQFQEKRVNFKSGSTRHRERHDEEGRFPARLTSGGTSLSHVERDLREGAEVAVDYDTHAE
jgi:hypothetical protein